MRLNHLDFHVPDIAATADFFLRYFALELQEMNERIGRAILRDEQGTEIVLSRPVPKFGGADQVELQRQTYHIGFILAERAQVDRLLGQSVDRVHPAMQPERGNLPGGLGQIPRKVV